MELDDEKVKDVLRELVADLHDNGMGYEYIAENIADLTQDIIDEDFGDER